MSINTNMLFEPTNWQTWTRFDDHPIFHAEKININVWSLDPQQYCDLENYGKFMPDCYVHVDPPPSVESQREIADRDIKNLANACKRIIEVLGHALHELVILDDFTAYAWIKNDNLSVTVYPLQLDGDHKLMLFADSPVEIDELRCESVNELVDSLVDRIGR